MRIRKTSTSSFNVMYSTHPFSISRKTLLMCPIQLEDFAEKKEIIAAVYIVTSLLSIVGAGSVLIYAITKKIVRSPEVRPLFHLALADFFLAVLWFTGATLWFRKIQSCFILDVVAEMVHLASFFFTVNYGLNAYLRLKEKTYNVCHWQFLNVHQNMYYSYLLKASYVVCWSAPVVIMLPLLFHGDDPKIERVNSIYCSRCLLLFDRPKAGTGKSQNNMWRAYGSTALIGSLLFSIVALLMLYFMILRIYRKAVIYSGVITDDQRSSIDAIRSRIFLYIMVFLICWSPALVVATVDLDPKIPSIAVLKHWFVMFLFQGLTAPMQGFLNCIVYGWTRKSFRTASGSRRLFRESDEYGSVRSQRNLIGSTGSL